MGRKSSRDSSSRDGTGSGFKRLLGWTLVLALVFSAGLISGERLVRKESLEPLVSVTDQLPQADLEEDEEPDSDTPTTFAFFDQLTRRADISLSAAQKKAPEAPKEAPKAEKQPEKQAEKPAQPKEEHAPAAAEPKSAEPKPAEQAVESTSEQAAEKPAEQAAEAPADTAEASKSGTARYTLQVAAHPDLDGAKEHMERLRKMGLEPQLVSANIPGKGEFYRVRVGEFSSMDEAREFQAGLKSKNSLNTFVSPL